MTSTEHKTLDLGRTAVTAAISNRMDIDAKFTSFVRKSLARHRACDWGDVTPESREANDEALTTGEDRFFSVYKAENQPTIWIITEYDHSYTTILFPDDY